MQALGDQSLAVEWSKGIGKYGEAYVQVGTVVVGVHLGEKAEYERGP
ncbi:hypothetical protein GCM10009863_29940 [Streptomyces axinellae]|uniref:Uncharacterized protein n=1 Tax=Streptomyces axinellae TaxID=552788 RepID=A0ABP6CH17_9ACTN